MTYSNESTCMPNIWYYPCMAHRIFAIPSETFGHQFIRLYSIPNIDSHLRIFLLHKDVHPGFLWSPFFPINSASFVYCTILIDSAITCHKACGLGRIPSPVPSHSPPGWRPLVNPKNGFLKKYLRLWVMLNVLYFTSRWLTGQWEIYLRCRKSQGKVSWYLILSDTCDWNLRTIWGNWLDAVSNWIRFIISPEVLEVVKAVGGFLAKF